MKVGHPSNLLLEAWVLLKVNDVRCDCLANTGKPPKMNGDPTNSFPPINKLLQKASFCSRAKKHFLMHSSHLMTLKIGCSFFTSWKKERSVSHALGRNFLGLKKKRPLRNLLSLLKIRKTVKYGDIWLLISNKLSEWLCYSHRSCMCLVVRTGTSLPGMPGWHISFLGYCFLLWSYLCNSF